MLARRDPGGRPRQPPAGRGRNLDALRWRGVPELSRMFPQPAGQTPHSTTQVRKMQLIKELRRFTQEVQDAERAGENHRFSEGFQGCSEELIHPPGLVWYNGADPRETKPTLGQMAVKA